MRRASTVRECVRRPGWARWVGVALLGVLLSRAVFASPPPNLSARSVVIIDGWTGEVLYEKNARKPTAIASITKIMTGVVVLEHANLADVVTVSKQAADTGESSCNLKEGEQLTVETLLEMALMRSGNDAAVALAIHVGGSVEGFAQLMNQKAQELGLTQSHFVTPHGLDAEGHYQSPLDVAQLARYALTNPKFASIVITPEKTIPREGYADGYRIVNTNKLLEIRPDCIGVKTGWTNDSGFSLCSAAQQGGRRFVAVVIGSKERFWESSALLSWAFETYVERVVVGAGMPIEEIHLEGAGVPLWAAAGETLVTTMRRDAALPEVRFRQTVFSAPVVAGQVVGQLEFEHGGRTFQVPAVATRSVQVSFATYLGRWPNPGLLAGCLLSSLAGATTFRRRRR
jgi:serine-type D-Ala-D-Ala carboxypeptidase (penicillin-binding protein 5/6)